MKNGVTVTEVLRSLSDTADWFLKNPEMPYYEKKRWSSFITPLSLEDAKNVRIPGVANFIFLNTEENRKKFGYVGEPNDLTTMFLLMDSKGVVHLCDDETWDVDSFKNYVTDWTFFLVK